MSRAAAPKLARQVDFLLCRSCYWSASEILAWKARIGKSNIVGACPLCKMHTIESTAVGEGKLYSFDYYTKKGLVLEFKPKNM
jgi:hypothetical protein